MSAEILHLAQPLQSEPLFGWLYYSPGSDVFVRVILVNYMGISEGHHPVFFRSWLVALNAAFPPGCDTVFYSLSYEGANQFQIFHFVFPTNTAFIPQHKKSVWRFRQLPSIYISIIHWCTREITLSYSSFLHSIYYHLLIVLIKYNLIYLTHFNILIHFIICLPSESNLHKDRHFFFFFKKLIYFQCLQTS